MSKIDIDKFVCSLRRHFGENKGIATRLDSCLRDQGLKFIDTPSGGRLEKCDKPALLEKQGEQKSVVTPKFKVGDKVRIKGSCGWYNVTEIRDSEYYLTANDVVPCLLPICEQDDWEVEQKPAWSKEDEEYLKAAIWYAENPASNVAKNAMLVEWVKNLKGRVLPQQKQEWSDEDEEMIDSIIGNIKYLYSIGSCDNATVDKKVNWLKSLTNRALPQPKQEWSEEDRKMMRNIIDDIHCGTNFNPKVMHAANEREKWLKSICMRYQSRWKPSDEQMEAVRIAAEIGSANNSWAMNILKGLYEQLKAL